MLPFQSYTSKKNKIWPDLCKLLYLSRTRNTVCCTTCTNWIKVLDFTSVLNLFNFTQISDGYKGIHFYQNMSCKWDRRMFYELKSVIDIVSTNANTFHLQCVAELSYFCVYTLFYAQKRTVPQSQGWVQLSLFLRVCLNAVSPYAKSIRFHLLYSSL